MIGPALATSLPMLAEFALRLSCGLSGLLLVTPFRVVPPAYFRTQCHISLGLLVLAALDTTRVGIRGPLLTAILAAAVISYAAAVAWGLGLVRVGVPATVLLVLLIAGALVFAVPSGSFGLWALNTGGQLASAFLMGATLAAMLLGHYYLTAPAMSIAPLERFTRCFMIAIIVRAGLAGAALWSWSARHETAEAMQALPPLLLAVRWGVGMLGPAVAAYMTWHTVRIRSTQSATGILYIAMTLVLFGELTGMILSQGFSVTF
jgi:hypothetical protein